MCSRISIRPAKGVHITVRAEKLPCDFAAVLTVPGDRRSIFVVPWAADEANGPTAPGRFTYVGTTDTDYEGSLEDRKRALQQSKGFLEQFVSNQFRAQRAPYCDKTR